MRIVRYLDREGCTHYGSEGPNGAISRVEGDIFGQWSSTPVPADVAKLLAPIAPTQILCIGSNYRRHVEETKGKMPEYPVLFMKGVNALQHPGDPIRIPQHLRSEEVDYECELAVVIGKAVKNASRDQALECVLGYTCANDVSARDWQIRRGGSQWCRGKTFDTFAPRTAPRDDRRDCEPQRARHCDHIE